jgi:hypothetical protein
MLVQGGIAPFAPVPHRRTLGAGRRIAATLPPWPGCHGWPRGKIAHAPCPPPLHKNAAQPLTQGRHHHPAQPHLGVFPLCTAAKSEKQREGKQRKKRRRGKEKWSGAPPRRRPGTSGREPQRCHEEPRSPLPRSAAPLERMLSTPTPHHGRRRRPGGRGTLDAVAD